jgi:tRNA (mo5U34)-methyltransferase
VESHTQLPVLTDAERAVADALPIGADPEEAGRVLGRVPLWFHTFALNDAHGLYTPGVARDHRYRMPFLPASFAGQRVLDVGTFDGFYAFLAEHRGAARVVAVDNEQYVAWVKARWGIELEGGEGFRAVAGLLSSRVEYLRGDVLALADTGDRFDVVLCFGILHRVENPLGLLRILGGLLAPGGRLLMETYGIAGDASADGRSIEVQQPGEVPRRRLCLLGLRRRRAERSRVARGLLARDDRCHADDRRAPAHPCHARAAGRLIRQPARAQRRPRRAACAGDRSSPHQGAAAR